MLFEEYEQEVLAILDDGRRNAEVGKQLVKAIRNRDERRLHKLGFSQVTEEGGELHLPIGEGLNSFIEDRDIYVRAILLATAGRVAKWIRTKPPEDFVRFYRALIDQENLVYERELPGEVKCRKGCAFCCRQQVLLIEPEGRMIGRDDRTKVVSMERLADHASWEYNDKRWFSRDFKSRTCPYLQGDNLCAIYDDRPIACRYHRSIADPALCDEEANPGAKVPSPNQLKIAVLMTAVIQVWDVRPLAHYV